jgi:chromosome segregation ATPase
MTCPLTYTTFLHGVLTKFGVEQQNLAHALDQSRSQTQDAAHAILVEARLRAEVSTMMAQRDEAIGQAEENKHKVALLKEQIQTEKVKLSRVTREKLTLEREFKVSQRTTETLVQSMENQSSSGSNDTEYYKRKVSELTGRLQSTNAVVAEKSRQIEEMRHQLERNMSQSRWASMSTNNHNSSSSDGGNKRT